MEVLSWKVAAASLVLAASVMLTEGSGCSNQRMIRYYYELGCSAVPVDSDCPTSFNCEKFHERDLNKCWLNGQEHEVGQQGSPQNSPCTFDCSCTVSNNRTEWSCIHSECPEEFNEHPSNGCYLTYELDKCCSTGVQCVKPDTVKCQHEDNEYYDGQNIYFNSEPCKVCLCNKDFTANRLCQEVSCDVLIHWALELQKGCAPVFYGKRACCPIQWRCPQRGDTVIPRKTKQPSTHDLNEKTCSFGNLTLHVGDRVVKGTKKKSSCMQCKCQLPPHVTCIQNPKCTP